MRLPAKEIVRELRDEFPCGTRVILVHMDDPQAPPIGTLGTVVMVDAAATIHVDWDNGCGLGVAYKVDVCRKVE